MHGDLLLSLSMFALFIILIGFSIKFVFNSVNIYKKIQRVQRNMNFNCNNSFTKSISNDERLELKYIIENTNTGYPHKRKR